MIFRHFTSLVSISIAACLLTTSSNAMAAQFSLQAESTDTSIQRIARPPQPLSRPSTESVPEIIQAHPSLGDAFRLSGMPVPPDLDKSWKDSSQIVLLVRMNPHNYGYEPTQADTVPASEWTAWRNRLDFFFTFFLTEQLKESLRTLRPDQISEGCLTIFSFDVTADGHIVDLIEGFRPAPDSLFARCLLARFQGDPTVLTANAPSPSPWTQQIKQLIACTDGNTLWRFPAGSCYQRVHMLLSTQGMSSANHPLNYLEECIR